MQWVVERMRAVGGTLTQLGACLCSHPAPAMPTRRRNANAQAIVRLDQRRGSCGYLCRAAQANSGARCHRALRKWPRPQPFRCSPELVPEFDLTPARAHRHYERNVAQAEIYWLVRPGPRLHGQDIEQQQAVVRAILPRKGLCNPGPMASSSRWDPVQESIQNIYERTFYAWPARQDSRSYCGPRAQVKQRDLYLAWHFTSLRGQAAAVRACTSLIFAASLRTGSSVRSQSFAGSSAGRFLPAAAMSRRGRGEGHGKGESGK